MKIAIVSDAWEPQVNGVVRSIQETIVCLTGMDHEIAVFDPSAFRTIPCPTYPEIPLALLPRRKLAGMLDAFGPESIHIATEGPLGWAARGYCKRRGYAFTSSYHTMFPEYVNVRTRIPLSWLYGLMRHFHHSSAAIMSATPSLDALLTHYRFPPPVRWTRGVDVDRFKPHPDRIDFGPGPVSMYVGRVAVEKNIEGFLDLTLPGTKVVVGDGPQRAELAAAYPNVIFTGAKTGDELVRHFSSADVFVFPSKTDTFGLVMLEALACGVPVAALPVQGPRDVITNGDIGCLDWDLAKAIEKASHCSSEACRDFALGYSWAAAAGQFLANLVPLSGRQS
ncbi:MAG: glycosyltransferase family 1 protein [Pseudomonadota bacterium]